jgi:endogenous inhibitor of DNA gyrase (YacG/DUF329 family)
VRLITLRGEPPKQAVSEPLSSPRPRTVVCPHCKGDSLYHPSNVFRPFCSERCKSMDFGAWADEGFRVAADPEPDEPAPGITPLQ